MKILLPVDGSEYSSKALQYLQSHADLFHDRHEYTVLHVSFALPARAAAMLDSDSVHALHEEEMVEATREVKAMFDRLGWRHQLVAKPGDAGPEIARYAEEQGIDLIVMGTHGRSALGSLVLGSVAQYVLAECRTPVLLIR